MMRSGCGEHKNKGKETGQHVQGKGVSTRKLHRGFSLCTALAQRR